MESFVIAVQGVIACPSQLGCGLDSREETNKTSDLRTVSMIYMRNLINTMFHADDLSVSTMKPISMISGQSRGRICYWLTTHAREKAGFALPVPDVAIALLTSSN